MLVTFSTWLWAEMATTGTGTLTWSAAVFSSRNPSTACSTSMRRFTCPGGVEFLPLVMMEVVTRFTKGRRGFQVWERYLSGFRSRCVHGDVMWFTPAFNG